MMGYSMAKQVVIVMPTNVFNNFRHVHHSNSGNAFDNTTSGRRATSVKPFGFVHKWCITIIGWFLAIGWLWGTPMVTQFGLEVLSF